MGTKFLFNWWKTSGKEKGVVKSYVTEANSEHEALEDFGRTIVGIEFTEDERHGGIEAMENVLSQDDFDFNWSCI